MSAERGILLLGDGPEIAELESRLKERGRAPVVVGWDAPRLAASPEDPMLAQADRAAGDAALVIEMVEGSLEGKREALEALSGSGEAVILSSSLRVGPTEAGSWLP